LQGLLTLCRLSRQQSRLTVQSIWLHVGATSPTSSLNRGATTGAMMLYLWSWELCNLPGLPPRMLCVIGVVRRATSAGTVGSGLDPTRGTLPLPAGGRHRGPPRCNSRRHLCLLLPLHVSSSQKTAEGAGIGQPGAGAGFTQIRRQSS
jgi:hypothetical protein